MSKTWMSAKVLGVAVMMAGGIALATVAVSPDLAFAGGNGKSKGAEKSSDKSSHKSARAKGGNGAIASDLKWMNSANANANARANASENSRHGQLNAYIASSEALAAAVANTAVYQGAFDLLNNMSDADKLANFNIAVVDPVTGATVTVFDEASYNTALGLANGDLNAALLAESGVRDDHDALTSDYGIDLLSDGALARLHELLGIPAPTDEV